MRTDALNTFVPYGAPLSMIGGAGVAIPSTNVIDLLGQGVSGLSVREMRGYLESVADARATALGFPVIYGTKNSLQFMELQDVQELSNFFERRVSAYQTGIVGKVVLDGAF